MQQLTFIIWGGLISGVTLDDLCTGLYSVSKYRQSKVLPNSNLPEMSQCQEEKKKASVMKNHTSQELLCLEIVTQLQ